MAFSCSDNVSDLMSNKVIYDVVTKTDGTVFKVHAYAGRRHATHAVILTGKGHILFPDHGMCGIDAMMSEILLSKSVDMQRDACYALAALAYMGSYKFSRQDLDHKIRDRTGYNGIPTSPSRTKYADRNHMTSELRLWWSLEAYQFIRELAQKRAERMTLNRPLKDPQALGIPFEKSVKTRVEAYLARFSAETRRKMSAVISRRGKQLPFDYGWW